MRPFAGILKAMFIKYPIPTVSGRIFPIFSRFLTSGQDICGYLRGFERCSSGDFRVRVKAPFLLGQLSSHDPSIQVVSLCDASHYSERRNLFSFAHICSRFPLG